MPKVTKRIYRGGIEPVHGDAGLVSVEQVELEGAATIYFCDCGGVKGVDGPFNSIHQNMCQRCGVRNWKHFDRRVVVDIENTIATNKEK